MEENNKQKISGRLMHEYENAKNNPIFQAFAREYNLDENNDTFKEDLQRVLASVKEYNKARNTPQFKAISKFFNYNEKKPNIEDVPEILSIYKNYQNLKDDSLFKDIALKEGLKENRSDYVEKLITTINKYYAMKQNDIENKKVQKNENPKSAAQKLSDDVENILKENGIEEKNKRELSIEEQTKQLMDYINRAQREQITTEEKEAMRAASQLGKQKDEEVTVKDLQDMIDKAQAKPKKSKNNIVASKQETRWTWSDIINSNNYENEDSIYVHPDDIEVIGEPIINSKNDRHENVIEAKFSEVKTEDLSKYFRDALDEVNAKDNGHKMDDDFVEAYKNAKQKKESILSRMGENIEIKFNANLGIYQLYSAGELLKNAEPKKMSFFERRKFIKNINEKEGKFHSYKDVGKYVDPNVYELLKYADEKYPLENNEKRSVEYLRALKDENPKSLLCSINYDLRGINKQKDINVIERARIKNFAKKHEEMKLAEVERDPNRKHLKRWVAALAGIGLALGGMTYASKNNEKLLDEPTPTTKTDEANPGNNKEENENEKNSEKEENNLNGDSENISQDKEEIPIEENEKQDLVIGKEVTVSATELYHNCEGAKPTCDMAKFMKNNPNAKFILSRVAVKTENGYSVNTTLANTSMDELKEKYGQDGVEYWCNFRVEVPGGTYVDIGWANEKDVQVKEEVKKENPWKLDKEYVEATNEVGKSGVNKETENSVKETLKEIGIEADFEK